MAALRCSPLRAARGAALPPLLPVTRAQPRAKRREAQPGPAVPELCETWGRCSPAAAGRQPPPPTRTASPPRPRRAASGSPFPWALRARRPLPTYRRGERGGASPGSRRPRSQPERIPQPRLAPRRPPRLKVTPARTQPPGIAAPRSPPPRRAPAPT